MSDKILQAASELCIPQSKMAMAAGIGLGKHEEASTTWKKSIREDNTPCDEGVDN